MNEKKELGQFYTKKAEYITKNLLSIYPYECSICDPFCGQGDLLSLFRETNGNKKLFGYDVQLENDKKFFRFYRNNSLRNPPNYEKIWIITNPPYLAKNKAKEKKIFQDFQLDDLYKISLKTLIGCEGGVIILPVNFFSSLSNDIRKEFLSLYEVQRVNIFEEQVFDDTTYNICAFSFLKKQNEEQDIKFVFFPSQEEKTLTLKKKEDYTFAAEVYKLPVSEIKIGRLLNGQKPSTDLFLNAIDTTDEKINLSINENHYYGKNTDRVFATITSSKKFSLKQQKEIAKLFNEILNFYREKYRSLFLSNYRDRNRKRISFSLAYHLIKHCIYKLGY